MTTFNQKKEALKKAARESFLYRVISKDLPKFEAEVDKLTDSPGANKLVETLMDIFTEGERHIMMRARVIVQALEAHD